MVLLGKKKDWVILFLIIALAGVLRFYNLGENGLRVDEIFTSIRARSDFWSLFVKTAEEANFGYAPVDRLGVYLAFFWRKREYCSFTLGNFWFGHLGFVV